MKILLVVIIISFYPFLSFSQSQNYLKSSEKITFEHLNEEDGLSNDYVTCILQDSKGYMWFGTRNGLNKYDGYKFTIYRNNPLDSCSIKQNNISALFEDSEGNLWIATRAVFGNRKGRLISSLCIYNRENDIFKSYINDPTDSLSFNNSVVTSISEDESKNILFSTKKGMLKFNNNNFFPIKVDLTKEKIYDLRLNTIFKLNHEKNFRLLIGSNKNIFTYTNNENLTDISKFPEFIKLTTLYGKNVISIFEDSKNNLWFGIHSGKINKYGGLLKYNIQLDSVINYSENKYFKNNYVYNIIEDSFGNIWFGTSKGLVKLDENKKQFFKYSNIPNDPFSISKGAIKALFLDHSGVLWIGNRSGGINIINKQNNQFNYYSSDPLNENTISNNFIRSIYQDLERNFWIGTNRGLNKFDLSKNRFNRFFQNDKRDVMITSIMQNSKDYLWLGTRKFGLYKFNMKTGRIKNYLQYDMNKSIKGNIPIGKNRIRKIYKDKKENIWIGTSKGLFKYNDIQNKFISVLDNYNIKGITKNIIINDIYEYNYKGFHELWVGTQGKGLIKIDILNNIVKRYSYKKQKLSSLSNNYIWSIFKDKNNNIWCSTYGGLNKYNRDKDDFVHYKFDTDTLANDVNKVIMEDSQGTIWVGNNHGLFKYNSNLDKFILYGESHGIPESRIDGIIEDNDEFLWITFDKKIVKLELKSEKSILYKIPYSLENHIQIRNQSYKSKNGEIIFSGKNGFILFDPKKIINNKSIPNIVLTDFQIFNKSIEIKKNGSDYDENVVLLDKHISETDEIKIPFDKDVFSIEFAALDFGNPEKNKYAYKLDGVDPDWVYTDASRRFATYNQLNPGEYVFHVKGTNNDGIWNEEGTSLKIIITPLWWQTTLFKIYIIILILGIAGLIYYNKINALKKKHLLQEEFTRKLVDSQEMERKRIASELHDSHGQNLLVISNEMQYFTKEHGEYKKNLQPVTEIIQESIDEIRNISYALHPHQLDKLGLVKTIKSMAKKVSSSSKVKFDVSIDDIDNVFDKNIEINIYRIIQEAINNIIKHADATKTEINIKKNIDSVDILINDNGHGFDVNDNLKTATGLGLSGIHERVNLIQGKINIDSHIGKGTKINISIPS